MAAEPLLTFRAGGASFAIPAARVREVTGARRLTRVPHAPPSLIGIGNFRGAALPVLSFAALLARPRGDEARILLVEDIETVGIAVDTIEGIAADAVASEPIALTPLIAASLGAATPRRSSQTAVTIAPVADDRSTIALLVFAIAEQDFALPLDTIEAVLRLPDDVTPLPHADPAVVGSIAVRDTILPLLSLAALLALPGAAPRTRSPVIVVRIGTHQIGLVVDAVQMVARVPARHIDPLPAVLNRGGGEARIQAICRLAGGTRLVSVLAPEHLLNTAQTERLMHARIDTPAAAGEEDEPTEPFLQFRIGDGTYALPIAAIDQVVHLPARLTRLPKLPSFVAGVINLRGVAVPVVDQVERFSGVAACGPKRRIIVIQLGALRLGILVDSLTSVLRVPLSKLRDAPHLGGGETRVFERVATVSEDGGIVLVLSPRDVLDSTEHAVLAALATRGMAVPS